MTDFNEEGEEIQVIRPHKVRLSYKGALETAGVKVHLFKEFGSYQGEWWAKVTMADGRKGWIRGYYGSCSGCDALQAAFSWDFGADDPDGTYEDRLLSDEEFAQWKEFSEGETAFFYTQEEVEIEAGKNLEWDQEAKEVLSFIEGNVHREID